MSQLGRWITGTAVLWVLTPSAAARADGQVLQAPPGHRWVKGPDNNIIAILIGLQPPGEQRIGGARPHEPGPAGGGVPYVGRETIRYRCACHITDEEGPCDVIIDDLDKKATCTGSCGDLKPCRWKAGPGPEEPEDQTPFGRRPGLGPAAGGDRVAPTEPKQPSYIEQKNLFRGTRKVQPKAQVPAVPERSAPAGSAGQPAPTKPGFIWVDDHWERPRAK